MVIKDMDISSEEYIKTMKVLNAINHYDIKIKNSHSVTQSQNLRALRIRDIYRIINN